ncbi:MAG: glycosyltransferase family 39 protein [Alphaproteobacteria bacterium]|nr:glycosyltransferase family 39 protein [Alphaproteobacteria bacterium]
MIDILRNQLKDFDENAFCHALKIFIYMAMLVLIYGAIYSGFQIVDEFEHLHASWLVSIGQIPYKDFFEHHHPLLWYISAPIVSLFYDDVMIFYVMRGISFGISLITLFFIYKTALFFTNKSGAMLALAISLCDIITIYNFYQFRPDIFMNLFFIMGIYYWFVYLKNNTLKHLIISFLCFSISLLFLQKIGLLLCVVEVILLYMIITKKMKLKKVIIAAFPSILLVGLCVLFLIRKDTFFEYFALNFRFNQALVYYFDRGSFWLSNLVFRIYVLGVIFSIYFFKKENIYFKIIALLFLAEFFMRNFYFSPHPNYYTLFVFLLSLVLSVVTKELLPSHKIISFFVILGLFLKLGISFNTLAYSSDKYNSYEHYKLAKYVHKNSSDNDIIMNGYDKNFNIYRKDANYYWFGLDMLIPVMEQEFGVKDLIDINVDVINKRPKFIYTKNYVDLRALRMYGETKYSQVFIPEIINILYKKTDFENLVILK